MKKLRIRETKISIDITVTRMEGTETKPGRWDLKIRGLNEQGRIVEYKLTNLTAQRYRKFVNDTRKALDDYFATNVTP